MVAFSTMPAIAMTSEQFSYWLQGFAELNQQAPNAEQWQAIRDHLQLVFKKEPPARELGGPIRAMELRQSGVWPFNPNAQPTITC